MQNILKYKVALVIFLMLFMILSYYISALTMKEHLSPISSNLWTLLANDVSDQAIATNKIHADFGLFYQFVKFTLGKLSILANYLCMKTDLILNSAKKIDWKLAILFFTLYYQLARTSSEKSGPYILIGYCF